MRFGARRRYSAEQVFDVVADVDNYHKFLPWCQSSKCTRGASDRERVGELVIGFREFNERYVSHISLDRPHRIRVAAQRGLLFKHQVTTWEFKQLTGATDRSHGSTRVSFEIDFEFESLLYRQAAELFLSEVAKRMVDAFNSRCATLYGLRPSPGRRS